MLFRSVERRDGPQELALQLELRVQESQRVSLQHTGGFSACLRREERLWRDRTEMSKVLACSYNEKSSEPSAEAGAVKTARSQSRIELRDGVLPRAKLSRIGRSDGEGLQLFVREVCFGSEGTKTDSMRHVEGRPSLPARPISWE